MKLALAICPFFTNGDWPPLGLSCVNGALRAAGHETVCFDFIYHGFQNHPDPVKLNYHLAGLGLVKDDVLFWLKPELALWFLFKDHFPGFKWNLGLSPDDLMRAGVMHLGLRAAVREQARMVLDSRPDAVLFSTYVTNLLWSLKLAQEIKAAAPALPIIFGGPGAGLPEVRRLILALGFVDAAAVGEGESTAVAIADDLAGALAGAVNGVAVEGKELVERPVIPLLDLPRPSFEGFPLPGLALSDYARARPHPFLTPFFRGWAVYCSRGCRNRCAYCSETAYWKTHRLLAPGRVIEEIKRRPADEADGKRYVLFGDSAINGSREWMDEFVTAMAADPAPPVMCGYMIATPELDAEMGRAIRRAGFRFITLGIETFSSAIRKTMGKPHGEDELFEAILALTRAGVNVKTNLLVGFPGETEEDYQTSIHYIRRWRETPPDERGPGWIYFDAGHPVRLEAYSRMYRQPDRFGITIAPRPAPALPEGLAHLAGPLAAMFLRWDAPGRDQTERRSAEMKELAAAVWAETV